MGVIASQISSLTIVFSTVYLDRDQRKHLSSASLAFVRGIHRGPVNSPHKWPVRRKMFHLMASSWNSTFIWAVYKARSLIQGICWGEVKDTASLPWVMARWEISLLPVVYTGSSEAWHRHSIGLPLRYHWPAITPVSNYHMLNEYLCAVYTGSSVACQRHWYSFHRQACQPL